ncbi:MCE family protein [Actinophytocola oryzae]|uniref:Phospholipid/cholesterol/gamma-HCH transport system substrate-binding protein n=1 Tax=Actinophytocola oryzae TaxID=502181 RepID=A0A4R7V0Q4_9PSEU|nr:MCE family protein [Actinophytocola oryzae]TDV41385.1 phospholipid/cholesterol/gamma-HCH transport system substrate-binding protein [Actinophytocola oryzae]
MTSKLVRRSAGVVFLVVMAVLAWFAIQVYQQKFSDDVLVTLRADRIGNQLNKASEVKARGVVVGTVRAVHGGQNGATVDLAMKPDMLPRLPKDVTALLIPKTLFGERYVQLSIPDDSREAPLRAGDVIQQDRSKNAIELERVFDDLLPVLKAVQPQKLATTLTAISTALDGRGEQLGEALATTADYLDEFNPNLPTLTSDLQDLAKVSRLYGDIAPDLLDALTDSSVTLNTVADQRVQLTDLYAQVTRSSQDITLFLRNNKDNLIRLAATSRVPLETAARYSPSFPCTLKALTDLKPSVDAMLGAGTDKPGVHVDLKVTKDSGKYVPGRDDPVYDQDSGPRCYPSGVAPTQGVAAAPTGSDGHPLLAGGDLGLANSPQEQELIAALLAPEVGEVPSWGSVLVGPLYRGTEVTLR